MAGLHGDTICLEYKPELSFHCQNLQEPKTRLLAEKVLLQVFGQPLRLSCSLCEDVDDGPPPACLSKQPQGGIRIYKIQ